MILPINAACVFVALGDFISVTETHSQPWPIDCTPSERGNPCANLALHQAVVCATDFFLCALRRRLQPGPPADPLGSVAPSSIRRSSPPVAAACICCVSQPTLSLTHFLAAHFFPMSELDEERLQGGLSHIATAAATNHTTHAFRAFTANVSAPPNTRWMTGTLWQRGTM